MRQLIILDDLRNNTPTAKFLHEELEFELKITIEADIICAPNPVKSWAISKNIHDTTSLNAHFDKLTSPIILIDWGMPVPSFLRKKNDDIQIGEKEMDGLYLFYLMREYIGLTHCFLWSQYEFGDAEKKMLERYHNVGNNFSQLVQESWLPKATTTGKKLANKIKI